MSISSLITYNKPVFNRHVQLLKPHIVKYDNLNCLLLTKITTCPIPEFEL